MQTSPPSMPLRSATSWPRPKKMPKWVYLAGAGLVIVAVLVALVHKPSKAEQASDLRGFLTDVRLDIESCAGGLGESLTALREVESGADATATDISQGISLAQQGAANCSPANSEQIDDLESYQVIESLDHYKLAAAVTGLVDWAAPDAERVQSDVANVLAASTATARARARARLARDLAALDRQRSAIYSVLDAAKSDLGVRQAGPTLPG
jgi:hypothetical protein